MELTKEMLSVAYDNKTLPRALINYKCVLCVYKLLFTYGLTIEQGIIPVCHNCFYSNSKEELIDLIMLEYARLLMGLRA